ncbi:hypothetical protein [Thermoflexus hugenholtzii]
MQENSVDVAISGETYDQVDAFRLVVEAVLREPVSVQDYAEMLVLLSLDTALADLLGRQPPEILLRSIQQLSRRYPREAYGYLAETLAALQQKQQKG